MATPCRLCLVLLGLLLALPVLLVARECRTGRVDLVFGEGPKDTKVSVSIVSSRSRVLVWRGTSRGDRSIPYFFNDDGSYEVERTWKDGRVERVTIGYVSSPSFGDVIRFTDDDILPDQRWVGLLELAYEMSSCIDREIFLEACRYLRRSGVLPPATGR